MSDLTILPDFPDQVVLAEPMDLVATPILVLALPIEPINMTFMYGGTEALTKMSSVARDLLGKAFNAYAMVKKKYEEPEDAPYELAA
ncbi:hypothetical protein RJT34_17328 [Clitoria ternatea]|uniref:Uncharacterized protein n=1 Tax=Clitoria ternatea TaxID=43366 RepID=A0AAN9PEG3_CLITE